MPEESPVPDAPVGPAPLAAASPETPASPAPSVEPPVGCVTWDEDVAAVSTDGVVVWVCEELVVVVVVEDVG